MSEIVKELITETYSNIKSAIFAYQCYNTAFPVYSEEYLSPESRAQVGQLSIDDYLSYITARNRLFDLTGDEFTRENLREILEGIPE